MRHLLQSNALQYGFYFFIYIYWLIDLLYIKEKKSNTVENKKMQAMGWVWSVDYWLFHSLQNPFQF